MIDWRTYGPVPRGIWQRELFAAKSPLYDEEGDCYAAAGDHSALCLAMLFEESKYGTAFNRNVPSNHNPLNLRPPDGDGYARFDGWADGVRAWSQRLTDPAYKGGIYARTTDLRSLVDVYAPATDSNRPAEYVATLTAKLTSWGITGKDTPIVPTPELRIVISPGHRNTTGGNPEEAAFTPKLASAYFDAFSKAGYETVNLGDTNGGLDEACRRMAAQIASAPGPCVLFDLHLEGEGAPGVFAIVPDITGLHTNAAVPQDPADTWENNTKDRELADQIAGHISVATGLRRRVSGVREPGIMDESQTGVGGDGFRLATFAYTSPYRAKAVRLVVEHGCHTLEPDRSIIFSPGFAEKCAHAALQAVTASYGGPSVPVPTPDPKPSPSVPWGRDATGPQDLNGRVALAFLGETMAKRRVPIRYTATADGEVFATMQKGEKAVIRGSVRQSNGTRWALIEINGGVGRSLLSAFSGPWPTT